MHPNQSQPQGGKRPKSRDNHAGPTVKDLLDLASPELREFSTVVQAAYKLMPSFLAQKVGGTAMTNPIFETLLEEQMHALVTRASDLLKTLLSTSHSQH